MHVEALRAARWKRVTMAYGKAGLSAREQQMIAKLADALQSDGYGVLAPERPGRLRDVPRYANAVMKQLFAINGSRWDLVGRQLSV